MRLLLQGHLDLAQRVTLDVVLKDVHPTRLSEVIRNLYRSHREPVIAIMKKHQYRFVEEYEDLVAFGYSREVDEKSLMVYLQKFSDDRHLKTIVPRMSDEEIQQVFELLSELMLRHRSDNEYHEHVLKDEDHRSH